MTPRGMLLDEHKKERKKLQQISILIILHLW